MKSGLHRTGFEFFTLHIYHAPQLLKVVQSNSVVPKQGEK